MSRRLWWWVAVVGVASCSATSGQQDGADGPTGASSAEQVDVSSASSDDAGVAVEDVPATTRVAEGRDTGATTTTAAEPEPRCGAARRSGSVVVWEVFGGESATVAFDGFVTEFNAESSDIRIDVRKFEGGSEELMETLARTVPEEWPDIVVAQPQSLRRLVDSGRIVPPEECGDIEAAMGPLLPVVEGTYTYDGVLQAIPYGVSTPILLFDAAEYRAAGLDPASPPRTLDELAAASRQIVESGASPFGLVIYDWYGSFLVNQGAAQRGDLVVRPGNGRVPGPVTADLVTPENVAAMEWLVDAVDRDGAVYIGGIRGGLENLLRIIHPVEGGTMTIQTSGSLGDLIDVIEAGSFPGVELGVGPMPGPSSGGLVGGNGFWLIDHEEPARLRAAYEVAEWMVQADRLAEFDVATGYVPPAFGVAAESVLVERWAEYPQLRVGFDQLVGQENNAADAGPVYGPSIEVDYAYYRFADRVLSDRVPAAEALAELTATVQELLDQYDEVVGS